MKKSIRLGLSVALLLVLAQCGGTVGDVTVPLTSEQKTTVRSFTRRTGRLFRGIEMATRAQFGFDFLLDDIEDDLAEQMKAGHCKISISHPKVKEAEEPGQALVLLGLPPKNFHISIEGNACPLEFRFASKIYLRDNRAMGSLMTEYRAKSEEFKKAYGVSEFNFRGEGFIDAKGSLTNAEYTGSASGRGSVLTTEFGRVGIELTGTGDARKPSVHGAYGSWNHKLTFHFPQFAALYDQNAYYDGKDYPDFKVTENGDKIRILDFEREILEEIGGDVHDWKLFWGYGEGK